MEMELHPCPFCGSEGVEFDHNVCDMTGENHIVCSKCGVLVCFDVDLAEEEVEQKWNRRTGPVDTEFLVRIRRELSREVPDAHWLSEQVSILLKAIEAAYRL